MKRLTTAKARIIMIRATGLEGAFADVATVLRHLGFLQIDPINVCGRMYDHILWHVHRDGLREAFEHHLPDSINFATLPLDTWPFFQIEV